MDADRLAFIEAIREDPEDDVPRLIFADWLDEQGDQLGEFIRIQCELACLTVADNPKRFHALKEREKELLAQYESKWVKEIAGKVSGYHFERGLIERLSLDSSTLVEKGAELIAATPGLSSLRVHDVTGVISKFINNPEMQRVRRLLFTQYQLKVQDIRAIAMSQQLGQLEALKLTGCVRTVGVLNNLSKLNNVPKLKELSLSGTHLGNQPFINFAEGPLISQIENLEIARCNLSSDPVRALLFQMPTDRVTHLKLRGNVIGKRVMKRIAEFTALKELDIRRPQFERSALSPLWESKATPPLKFLALGSTTAPKVNSKFIANLVNSSMCQHVETLILELKLDSDGIAAMCESDQLHNLKSLDLRRCTVSADDLNLMAESGLLGRLNSLFVGEVRPVGRMSFRKLVESAGWEKGSKRSLRIQTAGSTGVEKKLDTACRYLGIPTRRELW